VSPISFDELPLVSLPYHSTLDPYQAPTTYHLHRTREWTGVSGNRKYIYTAREYSDKYAMYMLEAAHGSDNQVTTADFFRVAEYPQPCINVLLSGIEKQRMAASTKNAAYKSRCIHIRGPFAQPVKEYPDRQQKIPWSPRRFTYGGRRFVWKSSDSDDDTMPETLYEYQRDWAKPGSRTGKRCDDAEPMTKLVWGARARWTATLFTSEVGWIRFSGRFCLPAKWQDRCVFSQRWIEGFQLLGFRVKRRERTGV
jgi:hypothetical protein